MAEISEGGDSGGVVDSPPDDLVAADDDEAFWFEFAETAVDVHFEETLELWETFPCVDWIGVKDCGAEGVPLDPSTEPLSERVANSEPADAIESVAAQRIEDEGREGAATPPTQSSSASRRAPLTRIHNKLDVAAVIREALRLVSRTALRLCAIDRPIEMEDCIEVKELSRHTAALVLTMASPSSADSPLFSPASVNIIVHHNPRGRESKPLSPGAVRGGAFFSVSVREPVGEASPRVARSRDCKFLCICSCDPQAPIRSTSSICDHVSTVWQGLWADIGPTAVGSDMLELLRTLHRAATSIIEGSDLYQSLILRQRWTKLFNMSAILFTYGLAGPRGREVVPVLCVASRKGAPSLRITSTQCCICRTSSSLRGNCDHQTAAKQLLQSHLDDITANDMSLGLWELCDGEDGAIDAVSEVSEPLSTMRDDFSSRRRRGILCCWSDRIIVEERLISAGRGESIVLADTWGKCWSCKFSGEVYDLRLALTRGACMDTEEGQLAVLVHDWLCQKCGEVNLYDGFDDAVTVVSKFKLCCRGLLDYFGEECYGDGLTFHKAYGAFVRCLRSKQPAARVLTVAARRAMSHAFAVHTSLVGDQPGFPGSTRSLLTCPVCCDSSGNPKRSVIDCTTAATSIAPLPDYERESVLVQGLKPDVNRRQFILRGLAQREGMRHFALAASKTLVEKTHIMNESEDEGRNEMLLDGILGKSGTTATTKRERLTALSNIVFSFVESNSDGEDDIPLLQLSSTTSSVDGGKLVQKMLMSTFHFTEVSDNPPRTPVSNGSDQSSAYHENWEAEIVNCDEDNDNDAMDVSVGAGDNDAPRHVSGNPGGTRGMSNADEGQLIFSASRVVDDNELLLASCELITCLLCDPLLSYFLGQGGEGWAQMGFLELGHAMASFGRARVHGDVASSLKLLKLATENSRTMHECAPLLFFAVNIVRAGTVAVALGEGVSALQCMSQAYGNLVLKATHVAAKHLRGPLSPRPLSQRLLAKRNLRRRPVSALDYERKAMSANERTDLPECAVERASRTGHFYASPGLDCPEMRFKSDGQLCNKSYPVPRGTTPGCVVACCICSVPIMYGASAMKHAEGIAMIWSVITLFFPWLRFLVYDNGCNLFWSVLQRTPMCLRGLRIIVDTFHWLKGHTCGSTFTVSGIVELDGAKLSSGEVLNRRLKEIESSARYVRAELFMPYVILRILMYNLQTVWRIRTGDVHTQGANLHGVLSSLCPCECNRCKAGRADVASKFTQYEREQNRKLRIIERSSVISQSRGLQDSAAIARRSRRFTSILGSWRRGRR